ncbi:uncharacterized protein [Anoplolepis gracilipes]|uniref:uncharacterized protein n=1 Tax=Anoplolepis gracilipes TaxID=354296 RepID=UPI003B9E37A8
MRIEHIVNRLEQQLTLKDFIVNAVDNLTKVGYSNITSQRVNARLRALKENWETFSVIHHAINVAITKTTLDEKSQLHCHAYFSENIYSTTYEAYLDAIEKMTALSENESEVLHSLLTLKRLTKESASELEHLYTNLMQIYRTLETLERPIHIWDDFLVFIAVQRLDADSVKSWEQHLGKPSNFSNQHSAKIHFQSKAQENHSKKTSSCSLCSNHYVSNCSQYTSKSVPQRLAVLKQYKLCFNCLGPHKVSECRIAKRCLKCGKRHHTSIHQKFIPKQSTSESTSSIIETAAATRSKSTEAHVLHSAFQDRQLTSSILLATAEVFVMSSNGESRKVRTLIDQGSEISLVSENLVQSLHFPRNRSTISLIGVGTKANQTRGAVTLNLRSHVNQFDFSITAHILPKLTCLLPSIKVQDTDWPHLKGLALADTHYKTPGKIDIILRADAHALIIEDGFKRGEGKSPIAQCTKLGWIISGPTDMNSSSNQAHGHHVSVDVELHNLLQRFWTLDEIPNSTTSSLSTDDQKCERHFRETHSRDQQGRYTVRLPFKRANSTLGNSQVKALRVLTNLSRKLSSDSIYKDSYFEFLEEYKRLDHMKLVDDSMPELKVNYYLPHHGVFRENSPTTKLRVVFNGSSRSTTGVSLNDLHTGAKLQGDVSDVLGSDSSDTPFLSISRKCIDKLRYIQMNGTFSEFYALRTIAQLVEDEGSNYPLAISSLIKGRYVDDIFGGADSIQQAREIMQQLKSLCMVGGFPLQKWISNNPEILFSIQTENRNTSTSVRFEDSPTVHVLGLQQSQEIPKLTFPRWINIKANYDLEIHGFSDASQLTICATVYIRSISEEGQISTHLICSKTKVAPIKKLTIPRLELSGAVLLAKLTSRVLQVLHLQHVSVTLWTDSSIVLTWINNHPSRWKDFIQNRVCYIQETVPQAIWKFVPGSENSADCATREITPMQLLHHTMWWSGPPWLASDSSSWPKKPQIPSHIGNLEERLVRAFITQAEPDRIWDLIHRYSSYNKLLRITALCKRAISRFRRAENSSLTTPISTSEMNEAGTYWIRTIQTIFFEKEIQFLSNEKPLPRQNPLIRLTPFLDSNVHIEFVTDYTTEAFLAAYRRFISRRGICSTLISDCGTNFKGADSEFKRLFSSSSKDWGQLAALLAKDGAQWKYIPPATPHFGGKWETGVKSVKYHLRRVMGNQLLTYEEMTTFLTQSFGPVGNLLEVDQPVGVGASEMKRTRAPIEHSEGDEDEQPVTAQRLKEVLTTVTADISRQQLAMQQQQQEFLQRQQQEFLREQQRETGIQWIASQIPEFGGTEEENVFTWVRRVEKVSLIHGALDSVTLLAASSRLVNPARKWYEVQTGEAMESWIGLRQALTRMFERQVPFYKMMQKIGQEVEPGQGDL